MFVGGGAVDDLWSVKSYFGNLTKVQFLKLNPQLHIEAGGSRTNISTYL
jgi:hypothetical protein